MWKLPMFGCTDPVQVRSQSMKASWPACLGIALAVWQLRNQVIEIVNSARTMRQVAFVYSSRR